MSGIRGEAELGSLAVYGSIAKDDTLQDSIHQFTYLITSPLIISLDKLTDLLGATNLISNFWDAKDVGSVYQELNVMGGGFLGSSLAALTQLPFTIPIYIIYSYCITKLMLDWYSPILAPAVFSIFIKSTPAVYWNVCLWIMLISAALCLAR